ncbi:MAG: ATP-binding protein, partial [Acidimicrobiales bacterium]
SPDASGILISATCVSGAAPDAEAWVELSVTDRGRGMSAEEQDRAFADFVQGDASDTRSHGGLGLGLSFVKRVVEAHGGRLRCESVPEKGSKFSILLPVMPIEGRE